MLYGGAKGGGKSDALLVGSLRQVHNGNYKGILFRRSYPELRELIDRSLQLFPQIDPNARYKSSDHRWEFPSGASIHFGFMDTDEDRFKYQGHAYQYVAFDEASRFSWIQYSFMMGCCRTTDKNLICQLRAGTNPGGPGHAFLKQRFVDAGPPFTPIVDPATGLTRMFVPAKVYDNPILTQNDPLYVKRLESMSPDDVKTYLLGSWDVFQGQVFSEWSEDKHVVEPFPIPPSWPRYRAFDWGFSKPFAVLWFAVDEDGNAWVYREWYGCKDGRPNEGIQMNAYDVGAGISLKEKAELDAGLEIVGVADPACWTNNGNQSVMETMMQGYRDATQGRDLLFVKGDNNRLQGLQQVHIRLGRCMLKVFKTCYGLIRTLPALPYDTNKVEDVDTQAEEHLYDSLRYGFLLRQVNAEAPTTESVYLGVDTVAHDELAYMLNRREHHDDVLGDGW